MPLLICYICVRKIILITRQDLLFHTYRILYLEFIGLAGILPYCRIYQEISNIKCICKYFNLICYVPSLKHCIYKTNYFRSYL